MTTVMEVDINKFKNNIKKIKKFVGKKEIMPVVKANGYGTYINKNIDLMNTFKIVGVANVKEAKSMRKDGYKNEILVLNQPDISDIKDILKYDISIGISSIEFLENIIDVKKPIKVELEIETGMNRTGIKLEDLERFISLLKTNKNIIVEGVYTHLSSADYDIEYTKLQINLFHKAVNIVKKNFKSIKYIHSQASSGILNYKDNYSNLVRVGIIMYGYLPFMKAKDIIDVEPICKLKTKITYLKEVNCGDAISYGRKYIATKKLKVATIPIGYADGIRRSLTDMYVIVDNKKVKIIGTICMDSLMIDVTGIKNVKVGDTVYIWDNKNITLESIAQKASTINYEILSTIGERVERVFV